MTDATNTTTRHLILARQAGAVPKNVLEEMMTRATA